MFLMSLWIPDFILLIGTIWILSYFYATRNFNYWKKRNVFYNKPLPLFGNFKDVTVFRKSIGYWLMNISRKVQRPYFGIFVLDKPVLVVKNPELVKQVMIKDFKHFANRSLAFPQHDKLLSNGLFFMRNSKWRSFRAELTPVFTSGKLKMMFPSIAEIGKNFQKYLVRNQGVLEAKETASKYATDVIAKCFFGIQAYCLEDETANYRTIGRKAFDSSLRNGFAYIAYFSMQSLVKLFRINFVEFSVSEYFAESFKHAYEARDRSGVIVNDLIGILRDAKQENNESEKLRMDKFKGAGLQFFIAGFETTSSTISFTLYELCLHKNIQDKLRQEIMTSMNDNDGLKYDEIMKMKYLDLCVKETLRKYPILPFLDRRCVSDYKLPGTDLMIEKGTPVYIPVLDLHHDEKYFPEPEKYIPERFENVNHNSDGLVYIPFGEGPRNCIGERFGLLSTKMGIISVLTEFEVEICDITPNPIPWESRSLLLQSKVGLSMTFKPLAH